MNPCIGAAAHPKPVPIPPPVVYPTGAAPGTGRIASPVPHYSGKSIPLIFMIACHFNSYLTVVQID